jgi:hypothetical protein
LKEFQAENEPECAIAWTCLCIVLTPFSVCSSSFLLDAINATLSNRSSLVHFWIFHHHRHSPKRPDTMQATSCPQLQWLLSMLPHFKTTATTCYKYSFASFLLTAGQLSTNFVLSM